MFILMHCGGLAFNGDTIKTKSLGGSETAAYYVAKELAAAGHRVTLFTNSHETGIYEGVKYEWAGAITEELPLGDRFTFYAENTPHDICIIQRHPRAFERKYASKQNFLWLHDLALYRTKEIIHSQMWNVDKILCVSEYHKAQVAKVYDLPVDIIAVVNNGVDLALYSAAARTVVDVKVFHPGDALGTYRTTQVAATPSARRFTFPENERHLFYSSRPERGLFNLVKPDGIMERLKDDNVHLHVCGYENTTPQMKAEYEYLWSRCEALPNVTNHGALTKQELAALQKACDAWVYPTEFEEVSCITAMEAMAAGCVIIASDVAALSETCAGDQDTVLIPLKDGKSDLDRFITSIRAPNVSAQSRCGFTWNKSANALIEAVHGVFATANPTSLMHHFLRHSDIKAFEKVKMTPNGSPLLTEMLVEYEQAYGFYRDNKYAEHYAAYYEYEKNRGVNYGPEDVSNTTRFQHVANLVGGLPAGARVLDYGCAHGHYTVALARRFPQLAFVGADLAQSNIDKATKWADDEGLTNVDFLLVRGGAAEVRATCEHEFDLIIAAEVIEHVGNPQWYVDELSSNLTPAGMMIITVPYGPWEAQGYREHGYWRAHLHHFERADLQEMIGHHPNYKIVAAPAGQSQFHSALGSYIATFGKPIEPSREINYTRKVMQTMPDQTVTCCMIVKDAEADIRRCLNSVAPHVQEFIIGVDAASKDATRDIIAEYATKHPLVAMKIIDLPKVLDTGFAEARNTTLAYASCDWILWIDADEVMTNGQAMGRLLRNSIYNGFAVKQHHFSADPAKVIKVDLPCRLFRNHKGIQFFGAVHEHPEIKLNEGLGPVSMMTGMEIIHHGYVDESVRRKRFGRNLPLLARDRKELPNRLLGKFLWLRDLAQTCQYEIEAGRLNDREVPARVEEGIKLWLELLEAKNYRLVLDALPYYSTLVMLRGGGVDFSFAVNASWMGEAKLDTAPQVEGYFAEKAHALALMNALAADRLPDIERRYM